jgi:hypothetical protein
LNRQNAGNRDRLSIFPGDHHAPHYRTSFADRCVYRRHFGFDFAELVELRRCHLPYRHRSHRIERNLPFHQLTRLYGRCLRGQTTRLAIVFIFEQGVAVSSVTARKKRQVPIVFLTKDGIRGASSPVCRDQMMLTNIKPSRFGFDLRTFKCDNCNHTVKFAVETNAKRRRSDAL